MTWTLVGLLASVWLLVILVLLRLWTWLIRGWRDGAGQAQQNYADYCQEFGEDPDGDEDCPAC